MHRLSRRLGVCFSNSSNDCLVFADGLLPESEVIAEPIVKLCQEIGDRRHKHGEYGIAGRPGKYSMKRLVVSDVLRPVTNGYSHGIEFLGEQIEVLVAAMLGSQGSDLHFQRQPCVQQVLLIHGSLNSKQRGQHSKQGRRIQTLHEESLAVPGLDDPQSFEHRKRLADRQTAGPEHLDQGTFGREAVAGLEAILGDVLNQGLHNRIHHGFARSNG